MVADVVPGTDIRGALSYNERKVNAGNAELLFAANYPKDGKDLSFHEKLKVLTLLAELNSRAEQKCVHISVNFHPSESFTNDQFIALAKEYMEQIGFGNQPYLVYNHTDAAHPHLHIVTTPIKPDATQIRLRYIGRDVSGPATRRIEKQFGLVEACTQKSDKQFILQPIDLEKASYGKSETKAAISNIVRSVFKYYKFTSLPEYNAILEQFNVTAYRGEPGMNMYEREGLVYSLIDPVGKRVGRPIKASSIYDEPTLKRLQTKFVSNDAKRQEYKSGIQQKADDILSKGVSLNEFLHQMRDEGVHILVRRNEFGKMYGLTYVDNRKHTVFNGSDLGKIYTANGIEQRLNKPDENYLLRRNQETAEAALKETTFQQGMKKCLAGWAAKGLIVTAKQTDDNDVQYYMGTMDSDRTYHWLVPAKMQSYFKVNVYSLQHSEYLHQHFVAACLDNLTEKFTYLANTEALKMVENCFAVVPDADYVSRELLKEARKKRRRRRG